MNQKHNNMKNDIKTLDDIFESDLFKKIEAQEEKDLKESGWTKKEIEQIANFILKNQK